MMNKKKTTALGRMPRRAEGPAPRDRVQQDPAVPLAYALWPQHQRAVDPVGREPHPPAARATPPRARNRSRSGSGGRAEHVSAERTGGMVECEVSFATRPVLFFFQAEDGIRYLIVTGVQTCALPI